MDQAKLYMAMKADISGSRTKNRFRVELLWGINKILELMESSEEFTVVFDYVCDIEVHKINAFEFYQVKTHNVSQRKYTPRSLVSHNSKQEGSILGKLFKLVDNEENIKVILVCNLPFSTITDKPGMITLDLLSSDNKQTISEALKKELGVDEIDFTKSYYLYTHMNLNDPVNEIKGELISSFVKIKGREPQNPNALYNLIYSEVSEKASYEYLFDDYDELKSLKGISRGWFDKILDAYCSSEKTGIAATKRYIESLPGVRQRKAYKKALPLIMQQLLKSRLVQKLESDIVRFIDEKLELNEMDELIEVLKEKFHSQFPIEYSDAEKIVLYILVIKKYEEGAYDNENDI